MRNESELGLDWYTSRMYDPALGRFIQPDSLIPDPGNSKGFDRYAYVNNDPVNFNDPSGHMRDKEFGGGGSWDGNLELKDTQTESKNGEDAAGDGAVIVPTIIVDEGVIYFNTWVYDWSDVEDLTLAHRAEETYTGVGNIPDLNYFNLTNAQFAVVASTDLAGVVSDFQVGSIAKQQIYFSLGWRQTSNGMMLTNLNIYNVSPVFTQVKGVEISSFNSRQIIEAPTDIMRQGDSVSIDLYKYVSQQWNSILSIKLRAAAFPKIQSVDLYFPANYIPPSGCSTQFK